MKLTLIRHTAPEIPDGICYGFSDIPLAKTFDEEIVQIKKRIQHTNFRHIYSSPLIRCTKLAQGLFPESSVVFDARLKELNFGEWEGRRWDEISKIKYAQAWFSDYVKTPCPNGESFAELTKRVKSFINDLPIGAEPCIITHSGTIRAFFIVLKSISPNEAFDLKIPFGGVVEIKVG